MSGTWLLLSMLRGCNSLFVLLCYCYVAKTKLKQCKQLTLPGCLCEGHTCKSEGVERGSCFHGCRAALQQPREQQLVVVMSHSG